MGFWMLRNVFSPIYVKCHHLSSNANSLKSLKLAVFFFFFFSLKDTQIKAEKKKIHNNPYQTLLNVAPFCSWPARQGGWSTPRCNAAEDRPWRDQPPGKDRSQNRPVHRAKGPRHTDTLAGQCANAFTSFFIAVCSLMSWSKTAPYSSWSFCISLMWLATLFMAFVATKRDNNRRHLQFEIKGITNAEGTFTIQVVVLFAVRVSEGVELLQQQRVLQNSLDGFDQVRLQSGRMLLSGVSLGQEGLEIGVGFCWKSRNISAIHKIQK